MLFRGVCLLAAVVAAATCSDGTPVGLRSVAPGHGALALRTSFANLPPGSPSIPLSKIRAVLVSPSGDSIVVEAVFHGDSAILEFDVPLRGGPTDFQLTTTAFDLSGAVAYITPPQTLTIKPGNNPSPPPVVLVYAGADAGVTTVHVVPPTLALNTGATGSVSLTGTNATGQPVVAIRVGWTSRDATVATVDASGTVIAGAFQGSTWIVGRTANNLVDSSQVKVKAPLAKITLTPPTLTVARGQSLPIVADLRDSTNRVIDDRAPVYTSSDPTVATVVLAAASVAPSSNESAAAAVIANGTVLGMKIGTATITAALEGKSATTAVTVVSPVDHIDLSPATLSFASIGQTAPLTAKVVGRPGVVVDVTVPTFSTSNAAVASVNGAGVVTAIGNGSATIIAQIDNVTSSVGVTVKQVASSVTLAPKSATATSLGETKKFVATVLDGVGAPIQSPVIAWTTSNPAIATVDNTGQATAFGAGTATITATVDGKSDAASFIVSPIPRMLLVFTNKAKINAGETATVSAKYGDAGGSAIGDASATYTTTTPAIASVVGSTVTGIAGGTAHIIGTAGSLTGSVDIIVVAPVGGGGGLTITPDHAEKLPNGSQTFTVSAGGNGGPYAWTVNGIPGGNAVFGTIDVEGDYTAPASVPTPAIFDVCASQANPPLNGCSHVTISAVPSGGADLLVINDMNLTQDGFIQIGDTRQFFKNVVGFTPVGPRSTATRVIFSFGHGTLCICTAPSTTTLRADMLTVGITGVVDDFSPVLAPIAPDVKVLFLADPTSGYTNAELNVLKQFASEGGRIVFLGENGGYYGQYINLENTFLSSMGAQLQNERALASCFSPLVDAAHIMPHQTTVGVNSIEVPCASPILLGPNDYAIAFNKRDDNSGLYVPIIAVAKIDLTPVPVGGPNSLRRSPATSLIKRPAPAATPTFGVDLTGLGPGVVKKKP